MMRRSLIDSRKSLIRASPLGRSVSVPMIRNRSPIGSSALVASKLELIHGLKRKSSLEFRLFCTTGTSDIKKNDSSRTGCAETAANDVHGDNDGDDDIDNGSSLVVDGIEYSQKKANIGDPGAHSSQADVEMKEGRKRDYSDREAKTGNSNYSLKKVVKKLEDQLRQAKDSEEAEKIREGSATEFDNIWGEICEENPQGQKINHWRLYVRFHLGAQIPKSGVKGIKSSSLSKNELGELALTISQFDLESAKEIVSGIDCPTMRIELEIHMLCVVNKPARACNILKAHISSSSKIKPAPKGNIANNVVALSQDLILTLIDTCLRHDRSDLAIPWLKDAVTDNKKFTISPSLNKKAFEKRALVAIRKSAAKHRINHVQNLISTYGHPSLFDDSPDLATKVCNVAILCQRPLLALDVVKSITNPPPEMSQAMFQILCMQGKCFNAIELALDLWSTLDPQHRDLSWFSVMLLAVYLKQNNEELPAYLKLVQERANGRSINQGLVCAVMLANSNQPDIALSIFEEARRLCPYDKRLYHTATRIYAIHGEWRRLQHMIEIYRARGDLDHIAIDTIFRGFMFAGRVDLAFDLLLSRDGVKEVQIHTIGYAIEYANSAFNDLSLVQSLAQLYNQKLTPTTATGPDSSSRNLNLFLSDLMVLKECSWMFEKVQQLEQRVHQQEKFKKTIRSEEKFI